MKKNIGSTDKIIRLSIAAIIAILFFANVISGTTALVLGAIAVIFALTSLLNFCPLYLPLGISTCKTK
ncbi:MAG: DUF2892 domain-containing protein [Chitinophagaceae bacterium]|nr:DUF2892 domain-containing protein [Chitinophagaceae bacterium]